MRGKSVCVGNQKSVLETQISQLSFERTRCLIDVGGSWMLSLQYNDALLKVPFLLSVKWWKEGRLAQFCLASCAPFLLTNMESALRHICGHLKLMDGKLMKNCYWAHLVFATFAFPSNNLESRWCLTAHAARGQHQLTFAFCLTTVSLGRALSNRRSSIWCTICIP